MTTRKQRLRAREQRRQEQRTATQAVFGGQCSECDEQYGKGDWIVRRSRGWEHLDCVDAYLDGHISDASR